MNVEELRTYCLKKPATSEGFPFDEKTLVFKVSGKMFALVPLENSELRVNLKCDPDLAIKLREEHHSVLPGYHMSKTHWNTVVIDGSVDDDTIKEWIDLSYHLVASKLPKKEREKLGL
jgi:predicted DNA-binding protein (MmcQ/YjbR family)